MTHMTSNIARTTASIPLNREEATRMVNTVSHKIIDVLCHQTANTSINLDTIATMFCQKAVTYISADLYRCTNMTYADIMNGTMDDFRVYIGHVNNYVNRLLNWRYGSVSIYKAVYKGGYDSIKASGIVGRFTRKPDECFNDAMLKPFFVAGCMNEIRSLVKDYEARTSKTDTVACNKKPADPVHAAAGIHNQNGTSNHPAPDAVLRQLLSCDHPRRKDADQCRVRTDHVSPPISPSASLYLYISKLPCQA